MFNESDGWMVEENLRGFRDSASLARFRGIFPEQTPRKPVTKAGDYRSPFVAAVLDLNSHGVDFREAQWPLGKQLVAWNLRPLRRKFWRSRRTF